jgi:GNAT superfamily N-acetyltransferase
VVGVRFLQQSLNRRECPRGRSSASTTQKLPPDPTVEEIPTGVIEMARQLAAAVGDPEPSLAEADLLRDGSGPQRWFDCLVAEVAGRLVVYAVVCKGFEAHTARKRLWLGDFYVQPDARRRGIGRTLMAAVARHALQLGWDAMYWELWRMNRGAKHFIGVSGRWRLSILRRCASTRIASRRSLIVPDGLAVIGPGGRPLCATSGKLLTLAWPLTA